MILSAVGLKEKQFVFFSSVCAVYLLLNISTALLLKSILFDIKVLAWKFCQVWLNA